MTRPIETLQRRLDEYRSELHLTLSESETLQTRLHENNLRIVELRATVKEYENAIIEMTGK